ncbi:MAG: hypothetical protein ACRCZ2_00030 [Fusobacteriaceae bacterium]
MQVNVSKKNLNIELICDVKNGFKINGSITSPQVTASGECFEHIREYVNLTHTPLCLIEVIYLKRLCELWKKSTISSLIKTEKEDLVFLFHNYAKVECKKNNI